MASNRHAWQSATGAMLWEIWLRHKASFLWQGVALGAGLCFVQWKRHGASEIPGAMLPLVSLCAFLGCYLQLLSSFAYLEMDAAKVKVGYPDRLLLKPLRTVHLIVVPMLAGGVVTTAMLDIWLLFVLKPLGFLPAYDLFWTSGVLLSFFWWMQALSWGLPLFRFRSLVMVAAALIHLTVGVMPQLPFSILPGTQWGILAGLLVSAVAFAWIGLKLMRRGTWEGPSWISVLGAAALGRALQMGWLANIGVLKGRSARFRSAFWAQFWLEWKRQGLMLPGLTGAMAILVFPAMIFVGFKWVDVDAPPPEAIIILLLVGPLLLSGVMGPAMAKFDILGSARELPVYISVRPMTNGGFVLAKMAMALASSVLALGFSVAGIGLCLAIGGKWTLFSKTGFVTPLGTISYLTGCLPVLLLLTIMVWKNLLAGIGTGLTGRPWIANLGGAWRGTVGMGLIALAMAVNFYEDFRAGLFRWLTVILISCLAAKIAVAIVAFVWGLRRNAITARGVAWIVCGWLLCGLFVAGYGSHICAEIHRPEMWGWVALGGFLVLPLADLAIAPLALAWNRHR